MEARVVLGLLAAFFAGGFGACVGLKLQRFAERQQRIAWMLGLSEDLRSLLSRGVRVLRPMARLLLCAAPVRRAASAAVHLAEARGWKTDAEAMLSVVAAVSCGVAVVAGLGTASVAGGVAAACCATGLFFGAAHARAERDLAAVRGQVPDALRSMCVCFRSGLSLVQTLGQVAHETGGRLGELFATAERRLAMGGSASEALAVFRGAKNIPELAFVAVALDVQHQSGGSMVPVLEAALESVEGELALQRSLRVQTAQAKLSARIVTVMPFILIAVFSLMSDDFLAPFFSSAFGMALFGLALAMQFFGVMAVRRLLRIETG